MNSQVCLHWNNFQNSLVSSLECMWDEESMVDVSLFCEGQEIKAHKVVLSASSATFKRLLKNNDCRHPIIILHNITLCDLEAILQFIYKGEVNVEQDKLKSLVKTASSLQIRGLSEIAEEDAALDFVQSPEEPPPKKMKKANPKTIPTDNDAHLKKKAKNIVENNDFLLVPKEEPQSDENSCHDQFFEENREVDLSDGKPSVPEMVLTSSNSINVGGNQSASVIQSDEIVSETSNQNKAFTCKNSQYPPYPCPFCCRAYTTWGFRRRHIKAMHTFTAQLSCKWCSSVLSSREVWEDHVVNVHNLSKSEAGQGLTVLEEAHMVLQTTNPTKFDTHDDNIKDRKGGNTEKD